MKLFSVIMLNIFLISQLAFTKNPSSQAIRAAKGSLSSMTRHLLTSGTIFQLELRPNTFDAVERIRITKQNNMIEALQEINKSPDLLKKAQSIVLTEHGNENLEYFNSMIEMYLLMRNLKGYGVLSYENVNRHPHTVIVYKYEYERSKYEIYYNIKEGHLFKVGLPNSSSNEDETYLQILKDINSSPSNIEKAQLLVKETFGKNKVVELNKILELPNLVELRRLEEKIGLISDNEFLERIGDVVSFDIIQRLKKLPYRHRPPSDE